MTLTLDIYNSFSSFNDLCTYFLLFASKKEKMKKFNKGEKNGKEGVNKVCTDYKH